MRRRPSSCLFLWRGKGPAMFDAASAYQNLRQRFREVSWLKSSSAILGWDQETYMPSGASDFRADQLSFLDGQAHRLGTAPEIGGWIKACEDHEFPDGSVELTNVKGWRRNYDREVKLPTDFVEELTRATSTGTHLWAEARKKSDFALFQPHLEKLMELQRRKADYWGWQACRYDALLDAYEPGARSAEISALFDEVGPQISALVGPATEKSRQTPEDLLKGHYPVAAQQAFNREVAEAFGFDFGAGRIDATNHPFCTSLGPKDIRLTTRYDEADFLSSLYGVLHECGHGLYEQGLSAEEWLLPAGEAVSLGIHESQSRLWENHVGGSTAFWEHWMPRAVHHFPHLAGLKPEDMAAAARRVSPSFIRVEADEVTYDLHIILRFTLERRIINGELAVKDIPAAWNELFEKLLGLKVPDAARGCLQDIHWSCGLVGYFATYTLGNLNASQLMHRARQDDAGLDAALAAGNYAPLLSWLREKVHRHGQRYLPQDLMRHATGHATQASHHLAHLRSKYL